MAIILKANKVNLFVSSVLFVFWYHSPNFLDTPRRNRHVHQESADFADTCAGITWVCFGSEFNKTAMYVQGDQKVSVHLMITIQITPLSQDMYFLPHYLVQTDCLAADRQGQGDTRLTLTPSVIPNSNYVIMVSD
jgi:hypothetical protein